jgi:hypothetical protein
LGEENIMSVLVRVPVVEGKTVDWMTKRFSRNGDKFTTMIQIRFTNGSYVEMTPVSFPDGDNQIAIEHFEK